MKIKFTIVTLLFGIPAFLLGRVIWPDPTGVGMMPTSHQLPFFIFLSVLESLVFGFGVAFIFFGWKRANATTPPERSLTMAAFYSVSWMLISWWPHDNLHRHIGYNLSALLKIEYGFHFTLIIAAIITAGFLWRNVSTKIVKN